MGKLIVMSQNGDDTEGWDPQNPDSVRRAEQRFRKLFRQWHGTMAFAVANPREPGVMIKRFDPSAKEIIIVPQHAGG